MQTAGSAASPQQSVAFKAPSVTPAHLTRRLPSAVRPVKSAANTTTKVTVLIAFGTTGHVLRGRGAYRCGGLQRRGLTGAAAPAGPASAGRLGSVLAQSLFCAQLGQTCGGSDLVCRPGLRCTAGPDGLGICAPGLFHCSPCVDGRQFCCPPPRCLVRPCLNGLVNQAHEGPRMPCRTGTEAQD
jgi:hypothetical protein